MWCGLRYIGLRYRPLSIERASAAIHRFANPSMRKASGRLVLATLNNIRGAGLWLKHTTFGYTINTQCLLEWFLTIIVRLLNLFTMLVCCFKCDQVLLTSSCDQYPVITVEAVIMFLFCGKVEVSRDVLYRSNLLSFGRGNRRS